MKQFPTKHQAMQFAFVALILCCSLGSFAQKNSDGSYSQKGKDGKIHIYSPIHPGPQFKHIDTLEVPNSNGSFTLYYKIGEERYTFIGDGKPAGYTKKAPTGKNVIIDTLEVENPDGSIQQFFKERKVVK